MIIKKYKYEKVAETSKEWPLPTEPKYYFETGIRRSICITPVWTTWNKEQTGEDEYIFELDIVCVYQSFEARIEKIHIGVSQIEDEYYKKASHDNVIQFLIDYGYECERTKEQFYNDFANCLLKINEHL